MRTIQPWVFGGTEIKTNPDETGVTVIRTGAADQTRAMTVWSTKTEIQGIVATGGGTAAGMTELDTDETVGRSLGHQGGGRGPRMWITEDGDGLGKE